jgi:formate hydrogenlyase subunit 4
MDILFIFINVILFLVLAPFFEGVIRKITAKVQSRQGPPITQPYFDILKLLGKETINSGDNTGFKIAPVLAFASIMSVVVFLPLAGQSTALTSYADIITIIYLLTLGGVAVLLGALSSKNTFAMIGASREMITMVMVEPVLAMTLILSALNMKSLGLMDAVRSAGVKGYSVSLVIMLVVFLMALQAFVSRQPFDIAEAEQEILDGPFIEYSGPNYALFKYYMMLKQMFYAALFVMVFIPLPRIGYYFLDLMVQMLLTLAVIIFIALIGSTNPRYRIDQAVKYYAVLIFIAIVAISLSLYNI